MYKRRTDLALEAHEMLCKSAEKLDKVPGIECKEYERNGFKINKVTVLTPAAAEKIDKPIGNYVTVDLKKLLKREDNAFVDAAKAIADEIKNLLPKFRKNSVLVAGLGNRFITADAVGPKSINHVMVTRHLIEAMPNEFGSFEKTAAIAPGVLGLTGVETGEILKGICDKIQPSAIIVIDALASRKVSRLCTTVQISDTGIVPGSGVGNARNAITEKVFHVPVIAIGVPTVVDARTLAADIMEDAGVSEEMVDKVEELNENMVVTPKDIDKYISDTSKVIGYAINFALHDNLSLEDMELFLA